MKAKQDVIDLLVRYTIMPLCSPEITILSELFLVAVAFFFWGGEDGSQRSGSFFYLYMAPKKVLDERKFSRRLGLSAVTWKSCQVNLATSCGILFVWVVR